MPTLCSSPSGAPPKTSKRPWTICVSAATRSLAPSISTCFGRSPRLPIVTALAGKKNVIILERTDEAMAGDNPMGRDIRTALNKALQGDEGLPKITPDQMPRLFAGVYGLGSRDFRPEHTIGAYEFAIGERARRDGKRASDGASFIVLGVEHPYEVKADEAPSLLPEGSVAVRFHSIGGWGAITTGKNLGAILGDLNDLLYERDRILDELGNPKEIIHVSANPKYGSEKKGAPTALLHGCGTGADPCELRSPARDGRAVLRSKGLYAYQSARRDAGRRLARVGIRGGR